MMTIKEYVNYTESKHDGRPIRGKGYTWILLKNSKEQYRWFCDWNYGIQK